MSKSFSCVWKHERMNQDEMFTKFGQIVGRMLLKQVFCVKDAHG